MKKKKKKRGEIAQKITFTPPPPIYGSAQLTRKNTDLTSQEQKVFDLLIAGTVPKEIAFTLNISYDTVNFHRKKIYRKLGVSSIQELFAKYHTGGGSAPSALEEDLDTSIEVPFKFLIPAVIGVIALLCAIIWFFSMNKNKEHVVVFDQWIAINDAVSSCQVSRRTEEINGKEEIVVSISGHLHDEIGYPRTADGYWGYDMPFSGTYGRPNAESLALIRTMKSFSLSFIGDGGRYYFRLPTFETIEGDHWLVIFPTVKDEIGSIHVNVPEGLFRLGWSEKDVEFIQDNIMFVQVQPVDPGDYNLKFWDFRLYH